MIYLKPKPQTKAEQRAESILCEAFMSIISKGDGTEFSAETIFDLIKDKFPKGRLDTLLQTRQGVLFKRFKRLLLIHQSGRLVKSERPSHDGSPLNVWVVGRKPANGPLAIQRKRTRSDFDPSTFTPNAKAKGT
jgi:hypothetical protein